MHRIVGQELKTISPFKENFHRMAFYRVSLKGDFGCKGSPNSGFACSNRKVLRALGKVCVLSDWRGVIIIAIAESPFGGTGGPIIYLGEQPDMEYFRRGRRRGIHEIGHNFGLADLDPGIDTGDGRPFANWRPVYLNRRDWNVDSAGCPKWCASFKPVSEYTESQGAACLGFKTREECVGFKRNSKGRCIGECCVWAKRKFNYFETNCAPLAGTENIGVDCLPESGCYFGANYSNYAWRPVAEPNDSLMWYLSSRWFDAVSARAIQGVFECCLSPLSASGVCAAFRREYSDYLAQNAELGLKSRMGSCGMRKVKRGIALPAPLIRPAF